MQCSALPYLALPCLHWILGFQFVQLLRTYGASSAADHQRSLCIRAASAALMPTLILHRYDAIQMRLRYERSSPKGMRWTRKRKREQYAGHPEQHIVRICTSHSFYLRISWSTQRASRDPCAQHRKVLLVMVLKLLHTHQ